MIVVCNWAIFQLSIFLRLKVLWLIWYSMGVLLFCFFCWCWCWFLGNSVFCCVAIWAWCAVPVNCIWVLFFNGWLWQTLYKQVADMPDTHGTLYRMSSPRYLSLWLGLQHIGHDGVVARIHHSVNLVTTYCKLFLTTLVSQLEQSISCVCICTCTDDIFLAKWP